MNATNSGFAIFFVLLNLFTSSAFALDFYGANVNDKEVPTSYLKVGILGVLPAVSDVTLGSIADKQGLKRGDLIVAINGKNIQKSSELNQFKTNVLIVTFFRNREKMTINLRVAEKVGARIHVPEDNLIAQSEPRSTPALQAQQALNNPREGVHAQEVWPQQKPPTKNAIFTRPIKPTQDQIFFESKKGQVIFSHSIHLKSLNEDQCMLCHRIENPTHEYIQSRLDNHRTAHAFCRGCHQKIANAPTSDCLVCHKQNKR